MSNYFLTSEEDNSSQKACQKTSQNRLYFDNALLAQYATESFLISINYSSI